MEKRNIVRTVRFRVYGIVQGVGFRPTVARHAAAVGISGSVCNKGPYVEIFARGSEEALDRFRRLLTDQPPRRAAILKIDEKPDGTEKVFSAFSIIESEKTSGEIFISPDIAICEDCSRELYDSGNRRYLHPFINCTCCGPRLTILDALPYDRERTSMKMFPMCRDCAKEYHSPLSRRYDAQPVCCNVCGPEVYLLETLETAMSEKQKPDTSLSGGGLPGMAGESRKEMPAAESLREYPGSFQDGLQETLEKARPDQSAEGPFEACTGRTPDLLRGKAAITAARRTILEGGIVAVKGIGGFHLCCDAGNEEAVHLLRVRKRRPSKPFAVMMRDAETVERECVLSEEQRQILTGHQKPILLLERRTWSAAAGPGAHPSPFTGLLAGTGGCEADANDDEKAERWKETQQDAAVDISKPGIFHKSFFRKETKYGARKAPESLASEAKTCLREPNRHGSVCKSDIPAQKNAGIEEKEDRKTDEAESGKKSSIAPSVAPGNPRIGVMLPYAPLQLLLFDYDDGLSMPDSLVMTSGNVSGAPICRDDTDALAELSGFCDCILSHDRLIRIRADDSVMDFYRDHPYMIRRSRGYAPLPVLLSDTWSGANRALVPEPLAADGESVPVGMEVRVENSCGRDPHCVLAADGESVPVGMEVRVENSCGRDLHCVLAVGGELKNTFCIGTGNLYYLSPYVGDLEDLRTVRALQETIGRMETLLEVTPEAVVCDLHPGYHSAETAEEIARQRGLPLYRIQHHYAHVLACMAENDWPDPVIGVSFDGTGYGTDGTIWGGEILLADAHGFSRVYSIAPFSQIGGDSASRQGWRIAASMLYDLCEKEGGSAREREEKYYRRMEGLSLCDLPDARVQRMMAARRIQAVPSTSAGRLFDAVSAVLGICRESTFEGEASTALQFAAERFLKKEKKQEVRGLYVPDFPGNSRHLPTDLLFAALVEKRLSGEDPEKLAFAFHAALADLIAQAVLRCAARTGIRAAALTGGCFQNTLLLALTHSRLEAAGIRVLVHSLVPPNDGGIALGQAAAVLAAGREPDDEI